MWAGSRYITKGSDGKYLCTEDVPGTLHILYIYPSCVCWPLYVGLFSKVNEDLILSTAWGHPCYLFAIKSNN